MRILVGLFLSFSLCFSYEFAKQLPKQSIDLIESFDCFSKNDKTIFYAYILALKYRMDNFENKDKLIKTELDYWRLWHLVGDLEEKCALHYDFDDILEEILTPTKELKKRLKKLRYVESGIRVDGTSESSEKMSKYDKKLREKILTNPPKYNILKSQNTKDYNLTSLKKIPKNGIPKHIYDKIINKKLDKTKTNLFLQEAKLKEQMLRNYDNPKARHDIYQKLVKLGKCSRYFDTYVGFRHDFNPKRKLIFNHISSYSYYPIKEDFLPNEIKQICENIQDTNITTFNETLEPKKPKEAKPKYIFKNVDTYISNYTKDENLKQKMLTYKTITLNSLEKNTKDYMQGLLLLRLDDCLKETAFEKNLLKDIEENKLNDEYKEVILGSKLWWILTMKLKKEAEGENEKMKHFFDCNQSSNELYEQKPFKTKNTKTSQTLDQQMSLALNQIGEILKYYMATFEGKSTANLNNKKAIEAGIIPNDMIENDDIKTYFGTNFTIKGRVDGGVNLDFHNIPKGEFCHKLIWFAYNQYQTIHFNNKTYTGIDTIHINQTEIESKYFVYEYVKRLCAEQDKNNISFIKKGKAKIYDFSSYKQSKSAYKKTTKEKSLFNGHYNFNGFTKTKDYLFLSSTCSYGMQINKKEPKAKRINFEDLGSSYELKATQKQIYLKKYDYLVYWDGENEPKKIRTQIPIKSLLGIVDGHIAIVLKENDSYEPPKELILYDINQNETINNFELDNAGGFFSQTPELSYVFVHNRFIYIALRGGEVEKWELIKNKSKIKMRHMNNFKIKNIHEITHFSLHPKDKNTLIVCGNDKFVDFVNIKNFKLLKTYVADESIWCNDIALSDDGKYLVASGRSGAYIWKTDNTTQYDIILGNEVKGSMFLPNSHKFITGDKNINLWEIK